MEGQGAAEVRWNTENGFVSVKSTHIKKYGPKPQQIWTYLNNILNIIFVNQKMCPLCHADLPEKSNPSAVCVLTNRRNEFSKDPHVGTQRDVAHARVGRIRWGIIKGRGPDLLRQADALKLRDMRIPYFTSNVSDEQYKL